mgnify:CR=1 FL=1
MSFFTSPGMSELKLHSELNRLDRRLRVGSVVSTPDLSSLNCCQTGIRDPVVALSKHV